MDQRVQVIRIIRLHKGGSYWRTRVEVRRTYPWEDPSYDGAVKYIIRDVKDDPQTIWTFVGPRAELDTTIERFLGCLRETAEVVDSQKIRIVHKHRDTYKPLHDALVAVGLLVNQKAVSQRIAERRSIRKSERRREDEDRQEAAQDRLIRLTEAALGELEADGVVEKFSHTFAGGSVAFYLFVRGTVLEIVVKGTKRSAGRYRRSHPGSCVVVGDTAEVLKRRILKILAEH